MRKLFIFLPNPNLAQNLATRSENVARGHFFGGLKMQNADKPGTLEDSLRSLGTFWVDSGNTPLKTNRF